MKLPVGFIGAAALGVLAALYAIDWHTLPLSRPPAGSPSSSTTPAVFPLESQLEPVPATSAAAISRIRALSIGLDAPVIVLGAIGGAMETPSRPDVVAWYNFSGRPGFAGNAIFSGHVDFVNWGPAVFWRLKDLEPGNLLEIELEDGVSFTYLVKDLTRFDSREIPVWEIVKPTEDPVVTLITCAGTFSHEKGAYDHFLIVRASLDEINSRLPWQNRTLPVEN
jgi:sortase (surface protein transpeptidase)